MNYSETRKALLAKPEAGEDFPFGPEVAVYKIRNRMFATLTQVNGQAYTNLKCDPDQAQALRDIFPAVNPGYHMNKKHWNTITLDGSLPPGEILRMIDHSYSLVVQRLPKSVRKSLELMHGSQAIYS